MQIAVNTVAQFYRGPRRFKMNIRRVLLHRLGQKRIDQSNDRRLVGGIQQILGIFKLMRERIEMVGGNLAIESVSGKGTTVRAEIPFNHAKKLK